MSRFFLLLLFLLVPTMAIGQNHFCGKQVIVGSGGVVEWPLNSSGSFNVSDFYFALSFSQDPSSSPITSDDGSYDFVVTGSPVRGNDGTFPSGVAATEGYRWYIDNASYLARADDDSLDLATKFTWVGVFTDLETAWTTFVRKYDFAPPADGYQIQRNGATFQVLTNIAASQTYHTRANTTSLGQFVCFVWTFDGTGGLGASESNFYIDEFATSTSTVMNGPIPNTPAETRINASFNSGFQFAGIVQSEWTEATARRFCRSYRGVTSTGGGHISVTSASPSATLLSDSGNPNILVHTGGNAGIVGKSGWYGHPAIDNLVQRSSFESWPTWDTATVAGDGSAAFAQVSTATSAHGMSHISMTLTGTTSSATASSACVTTGIGSDLYVHGFLKKGSGTTESAIRIHEYSDASCTASIGTTDIRAAGDITTSWAEYGGLFASGSWNGSTAGWEIELVETCDSGCDSHWDAIQASSRSNATNSYCVVCDTDATCSCTLANSTITQSLTASGWYVKAKIRSPIDGADAAPVRYILQVPGTAGDNNRIDLYWGSDTLTIDVWDSGGIKKTATATAAGNANTDYDVEFRHDSAGNITACWDGSCGSSTSGATMDGISSMCRLGHNGTAGGDVWVQNLEIGPL